MLTKKTSKERGFSIEIEDCNHPSESRKFDRNCDEVSAYDDAGERIFVKAIIVVEYCNDCGKNFGADYSPADESDCGGY